MQPKKNPKIDLRKNSKIYFAIGLCLMMFLSWQFLEWKTYSKKTISEYDLNVDPQEIEEIPVTNLTPPPPPPPPPPVAPEVFNVIDNEKNEEETFIETSDTNQEEAIVPVEHVDVADEVEDIIEVPFTIIEQAPVFPGCEDMSKSKQRDCFQEKMKKHINKHFQYPEMAQELGIQGRVNVRFVIDERGNITEIQARGPDRNLEEEAKRIIKFIAHHDSWKAKRTPCSSTLWSTNNVQITIKAFKFHCSLLKCALSLSTIEAGKFTFIEPSIFWRIADAVDS